MEPAINSESIVRAKIALRKTIIQKRKKLGDLKKNEKSIAIAKRLFGMDEFKKAKSIFCFLEYQSSVTEHFLLFFLNVFNVCVCFFCVECFFRACVCVDCVATTTTKKLMTC